MLQAQRNSGYCSKQRTAFCSGLQLWAAYN